MCVTDTEIKLIDGRGRTVLSFVRREIDEDGASTCDGWGVQVKPRTPKMLMHERPQSTDTPARYLKQLADGSEVLRLPGEIKQWNWRKVTAALDRLADAVSYSPRGSRGNDSYGTLTIAIDELRQHVGY